ncbi:MAG: NAD-dependent epimerase/dehydratase family protein [Candidatus Omnitrophica bacterium]|nr:NAD-dependent epimerase/dehydratase family protein [Candidatus Omnitrophota bacterium]
MTNLASTRTAENILTTGVLSGLGRYIHEEIGGYGLSRSSSNRYFKKFRRSGLSIIIHCAFNTNREINSDNLFSYFSDNVYLTQKLVEIPHKKFIFISSADVYPKNGKIHLENEVIKIDSLCGIYAITKIISEAIIKKYCNNYLILRPTSLLGRYTRQNTLSRIIKDKFPAVGLNSRSMFNYIRYEDVLEFIKLSIEKDLMGIYNLASSKNILLCETVKILGKKVKFGRYLYNIGKISNKKVSAVYPTFQLSSERILLRYLGEIR